tara:strand:- start:954 stop:1169 length:216 start_codon:yes stop_codon:yes gene_type:complete
MSNCHTETIARYLINGQYYFVTVNWQGKTLADDPNRFYDIFDSHGACLNEGEPWHDDGRGRPTYEDVETLL